METTRSSRRLSPIPMADVVGYFRLMGRDESATIRTLPARRAVFSQPIQERNGRVVAAMGGALRAKCGSVVQRSRLGGWNTARTCKANRKFCKIKQGAS